MRLIVVVLAILFIGCIRENKDSFPEELDISKLLLLAKDIHRFDADSSYSMARDLYEYARAIGSEQGMAESSLLMGEILNEMGIISQANTLLNEARSHFQSTGQIDKTAQTDILLSRVYQRSENYQEALEYLNSAMKNFRELNDGKGIAQVYADMGHVYEKLQYYDSALYLQENALNYVRDSGDFAGLAAIHENIGSIYEDLEDFPRAFIHFRRAFELNDSLNNQVSAIGNLNNLGDIYRKQGDLQNALAYTRNALKLAETTHQDYQLKSAYRDLSKIYQEMNDPDSALLYLDKAYLLNDNLFSVKIAEEIARTQSVYELQQKQQRISYLESREATNRLLVLISSMGILLMVTFGSIIFYQQRTKNRKVRQLLETEAALAHKELENAQLSQQNLETELENKHLREVQLKQELELKSNSLTKSTLHMIQKNEFLQLMRSKLKTLKKVDDPEVKKVIKRIIRSIELNSHNDDDWREFENVFSQVHSDFYVQLNRAYPELTPAEVRLCAMIRLNMHSKDIATILGISQDSLKTARYRLRKKLELNNGENLYAALIKIK